jgi:hypothetical protein
MAAIEFDATVTNGTIQVPAAHQRELEGEVHVVVYPRSVSNAPSKIDELLHQPLDVSGFRPLTREEAHERS